MWRIDSLRRPAAVWAALHGRDRTRSGTQRDANTLRMAGHEEANALFPPFQGQRVGNHLLDGEPPRIDDPSGVLAVPRLPEPAPDGELLQGPTVGRHGRRPAAPHGAH